MAGECPTISTACATLQRTIEMARTWCAMGVNPAAGAISGRVPTLVASRADNDLDVNTWNSIRLPGISRASTLVDS